MSPTAQTLNISGNDRKKCWEGLVFLKPPSSAQKRSGEHVRPRLKSPRSGREAEGRQRPADDCHRAGVSVRVGWTRLCNTDPANTSIPPLLHSRRVYPEIVSDPTAGVLSPVRQSPSPLQMLSRAWLSLVILRDHHKLEALTPSSGSFKLLERLTELRQTLPVVISVLKDVTKDVDPQPDEETHLARSHTKWPLCSWSW